MKDIIKKFSTLFMIGALSTYAHSQELGINGNYSNCCYPSSTQGNSGYGLSFFADFLYWQAQVENTDIAAVGTAIITEDNETLSSTKYLLNNVRPKGKWQPGLRLGLGLQFNPCDPFDLSLTWTYFNDHSYHIKESLPNHIDPLNRPIIAPLGSGIVGHAAEKMSGDWRLKTNLLDLEIGKELCITSNFNLKPHIGLRGGWFHFKFNEHFLGRWDSFIHDDLMENDIKIYLGNTSTLSCFNYRGIGLKIGTDSTWRIYDSFSILAKFSGSFLSGKYHIKKSSNGFSPDPLNDEGPALVGINQIIKDQFWSIRTNIEGYIGLMWKTPVCNCYQLALSIGYDFSQWFRLNAIPQVIDVTEIFPAYDLEERETSINYYLFENFSGAHINYQGLSMRACVEF